MNSEARVIELDLARFLAAVAVLLYHYTAAGSGHPDYYVLVDPKDYFPEFYPISKFGFLGVNIFFVISGFVILASALNRTAISFAISRFTRLYPMFWTGMLFTTLSAYCFMGSDLHIGWREFIANLTLLNDYMHIKDVDPIYWTLHAELQFYGCIFVLIACKQIDRYHYWLSAWLLLTLLYLICRQPFFMPWFISPQYSSYFIAGTAFYLAVKHGYNRFLITVLSASLAISLYYLSAQVDLYIENADRADHLIAAGLIASLYLFFWLVSIGRLRIKPLPFITLLGALTYPLYLIHHIPGRLLFDRLAETLNPYALALGISLLMLSFSYILYLVVDRNLAKHLNRILNQLASRLTPKIKAHS